MSDSLTPFWRGVLSSLRSFARSPLEEVRSRSWGSDNFRGERHQFLLRFDGHAAGTLADRFIARLADTEFWMPGYTVADVKVVSDERQTGVARVRVEILTVAAKDQPRAASF